MMHARLFVVTQLHPLTSFFLSTYPVVEQRKRDRLLAYVLADLLGDYLVPITSPDQQRPAYVLATPLSYPQVRPRGVLLSYSYDAKCTAKQNCAIEIATRVTLLLTCGLYHCYKQFVEVIGTCLVMKASTQHELGLYRELKTV